MKIRQIKESRLSGVEVIPSKGKIFIVNGKYDFSKIENTEDIVVLSHPKEEIESHKTQKDGLIIARSGEYEIFDIYVSVKSVKELVEFEADGVRLMYSAYDKEIDKKLVKELGIIDVLIMNVQKDFSKQIKTVQTIDPQVLLIFTTEDADLEKFKKESGANFDETKTYKCRVSDFSSDEYNLTGVELGK
jgi:hypothetical protein